MPCEEVSGNLTKRFSIIAIVAMLMAVFAVGKAVAKEADTFSSHAEIAVAAADGSPDFDAGKSSHDAKADQAEEFHVQQISMAFGVEPDLVVWRVTDVTMDGAALCRRERPPRL